MPAVPAYLLHVISERGEITNLLALANELGLHYASAHRGVTRLERDGLVEVKRSGLAKPMIITPIRYKTGIDD